MTAVTNLFKPLSAFRFRVPEAYRHENQLATFHERHSREFSNYDPSITDRNFVRVTRKLTPGRIYIAGIFSLKRHVTTANCLAFLKFQKALLVGAQGLSLVWELERQRLPVGRWVLSFDERRALWKDNNGDHWVPSVYQNPEGGWEFNLDCFEAPWPRAYCLLCFYEKGM